MANARTTRATSPRPTAPAPRSSPGSSAGQAPLRSPGSSAGQVELEGPTDPTLTPPPRRRTSTLVLASMLLALLVGVAALALANPRWFTAAVQAFSGPRAGR